MKTYRFMLLIALTALALCVVTARPAFAKAGPLDSPKVAFPADYPEAAKRQVRKALQRKGCKFLRGYFVNWHTTIHYAGDAASLNGQIGDLVRCPGVEVSVRFRKLNDHGDWLLLHDARANRFEIQINLDSERVDLEKLVLPSAKGPKR
jgi:hypothetical protein